MIPFKYVLHHLCLRSLCGMYCPAPLDSFEQDPVGLTGFGTIFSLFSSPFLFFPFALDFGRLPLRNRPFQGGFVVFLFITVSFVLFLSVLLLSVSKLLLQGGEVLLEIQLQDS